MTNIIVIETEDSSKLIQDVVELISEKEKCSYTQVSVTKSVGNC